MNVKVDDIKKLETFKERQTLSQLYKNCHVEVTKNNIFVQDFVNSFERETTQFTKWITNKEDRHSKTKLLS